MSDVKSEKQQRRESFLEAMGSAFDEEIAKFFVPNCCIAATVMGIRVLDYFGIEAESMATWMYALNEAAAKHALETMSLPADDAHLPSWYRVVCIGGGMKHNRNQPHHWAGHLVIVTATEMIDLTAAQVNAIDKEFALQSGVMPFDHVERQEWIDGVQHLAGLMCKQMVVYMAKKDDQSFKEHLDWSAIEGHEQHVRNVISWLECRGYILNEFAEQGPPSRDPESVKWLAVMLAPDVEHWMEEAGYKYRVLEDLTTVLSREPSYDAYRLARALERDFRWAGDAGLVLVLSQTTAFLWQWEALHSQEVIA